MCFTLSWTYCTVDVRLLILDTIKRFSLFLLIILALLHQLFSIKETSHIVFSGGGDENRAKGSLFPFIHQVKIDFKYILIYCICWMSEYFLICSPQYEPALPSSGEDSN